MIAMMSSKSSTTQNLLALEGTPVHTSNSGTNPTSLGPFTTTKATQVVIVASGNGITGITSITGGGLTFTRRSPASVGSFIEAWTATAAAALSAVTFTITFSGGPVFVTADVFAISGNDTSVIYDNNVSIPAAAATDPLTVSTNNANDFIYAAFRGSAALTGAGAGWTQLSAADFQVVEYKIVSATQTNLSATCVSSGSSNGCLADALMSA